MPWEEDTPPNCGPDLNEAVGWPNWAAGRGAPYWLLMPWLGAAWELYCVGIGKELTPMLCCWPKADGAPYWAEGKACLYCGPEENEALGPKLDGPELLNGAPYWEDGNVCDLNCDPDERGLGAKLDTPKLWEGAPYKDPGADDLLYWETEGYWPPSWDFTAPGAPGTPYWGVGMEEAPKTFPPLENREVGE